MRNFFRFGIVVFLLPLLFVNSNYAQAKNYNVTFAAGHGAHLPWIKTIKEFYIPEVDKRISSLGTDHKIIWNEAYGGTVAKVGGLLEAVQEGVAEMGYVYTIFEPANLPLHSVTFMAPFGSDDSRVICDIFLEMHEMEELSGEWHKYNQVFLGPVAPDTDYLLTKFPVNSLEDLKGRKLGAAGSISLWASGIGIVPVQGNFATHFNNIKTGVYDGLIAFTTGIYPIKLHHVAPYATKVNLGSMLIGAITINKELFDSMPPEMQKILKDVGAEYGRKVSATVMNLASIFEKKMAEEGAIFSQLPASERKKWAMTMPNIAKDWVERNEARGLPARKVLEIYMNKLRERNVEIARDWDKY
jgi:TRAP-type C4-dicarboxylate transport system substrate-binding protein